METVAYIHLAQEFETSESKSVKFSGKTIATAVTLASTAWAGGLLTAAPALAYGYGCCRPRPIIHRPINCCRPVHRPVNCCRPVAYYPVAYQPVSSCSNSCYYPEANYEHDDYETSYYPDYYEEDYGHHDNSYEDSYEEIAYHPVSNGNLLKVGSSGDLVALLQQELLAQGFHVSVDGFYGHETADAVAAYQQVAGLLVDGVAGGQTLDSLGLAGYGA